MRTPCRPRGPRARRAHRRDRAPDSDAYRSAESARRCARAAGAGHAVCGRATTPGRGDAVNDLDRVVFALRVGLYGLMAVVLCVLLLLPLRAMGEVPSAAAQW